MKRHLMPMVLAGCIASSLVPTDATSAPANAGLGNATLLANDLRTDYRVNPLGLDRIPLRLSWRMEADGRAGARQTAYQIQSAQSHDDLLAGKALFWDSGRTASDANTQIPYAGTKLGSRQRIWWRVKIWDEQSYESPWSEPAWFETALLNAADWQQAQWIGCTRDFQAPELAPDEVMGAWIQGPAGQASESYRTELLLPNKPVVSAMAWWGFSKPVGAANVVANYDTIPHAVRGAMDRAARPGKGGALDLAFYLLPGKTNRIELLFRKPLPNVAGCVGMRIVFGDGEELIVRSGPDWQAVSANGKTAKVAAAAAYGGAGFGKAEVQTQRSLPPAWFRQTVNVHGGLARARLYLSALGYGMPYVNGVPASDSLLAPPQSDYEEFAFYTAHDITALLQTGANALAVLLDSGWYNEVGGFGSVFSYGRPGLKAAVALDYADGQTEWVVSGPGWQWKEGAIRAANVYRGERVDYRKDQVEWKTPGAGKDWQPAQVLPPLTPKLLAMEVAPMRACQELKPIKRWQIGSKTWVLDVGEMIHGWMRLKFNEPAGTTIRLRFSEYAEQGVLWNVPRSHWWCHGVAQGDEVIADGQPRTFEPRFTPKSFRYVEISGLSREPKDDEVAAVLVHTDAARLAEFSSSDPMLNRLFENGMRTHRNYLNHMFGDIPRERCLWGAESVYSWVTAFNCFDWAPNHRLMAQLWFTGAMTKDGIPGHIGVGKRLATSSATFSWSVTPLFIAAKMSEHYGDLGPAAEFYGQMRHYLAHMEKTAKDGVLPPYYDGPTDHAPPKDIERNPANGKLITLLNYFDTLNYFARLADALGKKEEAAHARTQAEKVRAAILTRYLDSKTHTFGNGTHDSLALAYGVMPDAQAEQTLATALVGYYRQNGHKFDGGFMSYEIYPMLARHGYGDDALRMLRNPDYPGPAWSVKEYDATTYWEAYYLDKDYQMNRGLNFIAFGHPTGWLITDLAGLRPDPAVPGGHRLILEPAVPKSEKLDWVKASLATAQGIAKSAWKIAENHLQWEVTIPPNTVAEIRIPGAKASFLKGTENLKPLGARLGQALFEAGPGSYCFGSTIDRTAPFPPAVPSAVAKPKSVAAKRAAQAGAADWRVNGGASVSLSTAGFISCTTPKDSRMLTTAVPHVSGPLKIGLRLRSAKAFSGQVEPVWLQGNDAVARKRETLSFQYSATNEWQEVEVVTTGTGTLFSLWLNLAVSAPAEIERINLRSANGAELKRWVFGQPLNTSSH